MHYTVKNLKQIDDAAQRYGLGDNLEARFARTALELENLGLSYQKLEPNFRIPFGHRHDLQEEVYVVVAGSGRIKVDEDVVELVRWDAVRVPSGTVRNLEAGPDGMEIIAIGAPHSGDNDAELIQEWWAD